MDYSLIIRPLIGAGIGYITNWIAVKMLFFPLNPVKIGKFTLPFTPGVIPKNKDRLAGAIGRSISDNLVNADTLKNALLSDEMKSNLDYYIADETIGSIQAGSSFTIQEYLALTDEEKEKCHSMLVTLEFEPETLRLDTTSGVYLVADKTNDVTYETITKNGESYEYVNKIQFKMEAEESKVIKFYKVNASENNTYPLGEDTVPIVDVTTS